MKKTKILTVANRKGGAGKSTCAAHLALMSVDSGLKTILIDLDPQKTLETWWKKRDEKNPYLTDVDPEGIEGVINKLNKHDFDLCIIDTPGDNSINSISGLKIADLVLIPSKPTAPDLQAIGRTIANIKQLKKKYLFLITQTITRSKLAMQGASVLSEFGVVSPVTIGHRVAYANAMNVGSSAAEEDKAAAEELKKVWEFVSGKLFNTKVDNEKEKIRFNV
jgi:chromosome partitioning protein